MIKKKKKKYKATKEAIASVTMRIVDPHKLVADNFLKLHENKKMMYSIGANLFVCVKVLNTVRPGYYENILVKIIEDIDEKIMDQMHGNYYNKDGIMKSKKILKKGRSLFANHLSLYTPEQAMSLIDKSIHLCIENLLVSRAHVKNNKERKEVLEQNKKSIELRLK